MFWSCRVDQFSIADHFDIPVSKTIVKADLKQLLLTGLVTSHVLETPVKLGTPIPGALGSPNRSVSGDSAELGLKVPSTLPRFDPSSGSASIVGLGDTARTRVRLARLQLEREEKERRMELEFHLEVKRLDKQADKAILIRELKLQAERKDPQTVARGSFDVSRNIALVPPFREAEVASYFGTSERVATSMRWPKEVWPVLLQCKLLGKAQDVVCSQR